MHMQQHTLAVMVGDITSSRQVHQQLTFKSCWKGLKMSIDNIWVNTWNYIREWLAITFINEQMSNKLVVLYSKHKKSPRDLHIKTHNKSKISWKYNCVIDKTKHKINTEKTYSW